MASHLGPPIRVPLLACLLVTAIGLMSWPQTSSAATEPSIFVFLPTDLRARAFEKLLSSSMPGVDIKVFGRLKDFQNNIKKAPPDAALTLRALLNEQKGVSSILQGADRGKVQESYALVSVDSEVNVASASVIGVVDILGRKKMPKFVSQIVNAKTKIKRVAKPEDLLSLLQFKMVDAILIPKASVASLRAKTELNLIVKDAPNSVYLPALGFFAATHQAKLASAVKGLGGEISKLIRVNSWRAKQ